MPADHSGQHPAGGRHIFGAALPVEFADQFRPGDPARLDGGPAVVHPVWERDGSNITGWVVSRRTPLRQTHLKHSGYVSCSYWDPQHDVAVVECAADWLTDQAERASVWRFLASPPPPLGWDPFSIFPGGPQDEAAGIIRLTPWRLSSRLAPDFAAGRAPTVWRASDQLSSMA